MPNDPLSPSATHAGVQWENQRPLRAVRHHCLDCARSSAEVALCPATACPLWAMRYGRRPTEELKAAQADVDLHPLERPKTGAATAPFVQ